MWQGLSSTPYFCRSQIPISYLNGVLIDSSVRTDAEQLELLKKVVEDVEYIKRVLSESEWGDCFLTKEKEVEETLKQRERGELLTMEEVFGE